MIRRLILCRPITEDEVRAAGAWAEKLGDERMTISYRPSPVPMRVLLFDAVTRGRVPRKDRMRLILDPAEPAVTALRAAMVSGDVVFNVFTGREDDRTEAYSGTDAVFTVAFPNGEATAWFARVASGVAPGIAGQCFGATHFTGGSPFFVPAVDVGAAVRFVFFKRMLLAARREAQDKVMAFARERLADVAIG